VHGGREAIELLSTQPFDLALCDLVMPDMTGMEVYEALRERHPGRERCLVLMTGGAFTERAREFLDRVPNVVLEKPFTLADLARVVAEHASAQQV
jgi:CheY-like chemotaxis protein